MTTDDKWVLAADEGDYITGGYDAAWDALSDAVLIFDSKEEAVEYAAEFGVEAYPVTRSRAIAG